MACVGDVTLRGSNCRVLLLHKAWPRDTAGTQKESQARRLRESKKRKPDGIPLFRIKKIAVPNCFKCQDGKKLVFWHHYPINYVRYTIA
jgi:hypothetical protein